MRENPQSCFHLREWPIFKMLSFLEYFVFFRAVFCTEQLYMICRMDLNMFFGILIFDQKWGFCKGYSLCMMADFQNALISRRYDISHHMRWHNHSTRQDWHLFLRFWNEQEKNFKSCISIPWQRRRLWYPVHLVCNFSTFAVRKTTWMDQ